MKTKLIFSMLLGLVLGSCITYLIVSPQSVDRNMTAPPSVADVSPSSLPTNEDSADPFGNGTGDESQVDGDSDDFNQGRKAYGYGRMDMKDGFERDICISFWYLDMDTVVENLELHTGHKFKKKLGKLYANPVEILEEQAAFMKAYLAESKRLSKERLSKSDDNQ